MSQKRQYLNSITLLRGLMIILVVFSHALTIFESDYAGHGMIDSQLGRNIRIIIYSFHMPVFMAISGYLFYFEILKCIDKKVLDGFFIFVVKKFKRLMIPFFTVMYLWRKPLFLLANRAEVADQSFSQIIKSYLMFGTTGGLWFLYVLFALFIGHRLFVQFIWKSNTSIVIFSVLFVLMNIASCYFSGPIHHALMYNLYFFLGAVFHKYQNKIKDNKFIYAFPVCLFIIANIMIVIGFDGIIDSIMHFIAATAAVFLSFIISDKLKDKKSKLLLFASDLSMGIYLFHEPIIVALGGLIPYHFPAVFLVLSFFAIGLAFSIAVAVLLRKVGLKWVMGE